MSLVGRLPQGATRLRSDSRGFLTVGGGQEALVAAAGLVGEVLRDVHVGVDLLTHLLQGRGQVGLPELLVQAVNQLC